MTFKEKQKLVRIHDALDRALGDTDAAANMTDEELLEEDPLLWAAMKIAQLIGPGPWDKFASD